MFGAVSFVIYGDERFKTMMREKCFDYIYANKEYNCNDRRAIGIRVWFTHLTLWYGFLIDWSFHVCQQGANSQQRFHDLRGTRPSNAGWWLPIDNRVASIAIDIRWVGSKQDGISLQYAGFVWANDIFLSVRTRDASLKEVCWPCFFDGAVLARVDVNLARTERRCDSCSHFFPQFR